MCGFAGLIYSERARAVGRDALAKMTASLSHRGPDDEGLWCDESVGVFLGFRRLSIIDLSSAGHQPMSSASGRFVLTFNGEIYNFRELRAELAGPTSSFRGHSDTEVMLAAFERWGVEAAVRRFRGMFAFAVWDARERRLWLARDRMGIKPLYLLNKDGRLAFASEARALHHCPFFDGRGNSDAALRFLNGLYVRGSESVLAGVEKVQPGELVSVDVEGGRIRELRRQRFWELERVAETARAQTLSDERAIVEELHELLREAIRLRLVADVPVGAFLSGGIDSSVVVAIMQELADNDVHTFTISFDDPSFDEGPMAAEVSRRLGTKHTSVAFETREVLDLLPTIPALSDEPMANPSLLPTLLVSQVARRDVVVGLSGDGGDELFGGYNRYLHGARLIRNGMRVPSSLRAIGARSLEWFTRSRWGMSGLAHLRPANVGEQSSVAERLTKLTRLLRARGHLEAYEALLQVGRSDPSLAVSPSQPDLPGPELKWADTDLEAGMMLSDQLQYLPDDLLTKVDRASMWASLEARVPILDHHIVEFSWRVPTSVKIRNGVTKWPLREIARRYLPDSALDRPKMGFTVPIERWLRGGLREWARDTLNPSSPTHLRLWDDRALASAWQGFERGQAELALPLWAAAVLQSWADAWNVRFE